METRRSATNDFWMLLVEPLVAVPGRCLDFGFELNLVLVRVAVAVRGRGGTLKRIPTPF